MGWSRYALSRLPVSRVPSGPTSHLSRENRGSRTLGWVSCQRRLNWDTAPTKIPTRPGPSLASCPPRLEEGQVDLTALVGEGGDEHLLARVAAQGLGAALATWATTRTVCLAQRRHVGQRVGGDVGPRQVLEEVTDGPDALVLSRARRPWAPRP